MIDIVFACLPHGASQETIAVINKKVGKIIDLSADFRLRDPKLYEQTYGRPHVEADLLKNTAYGLTEFNRDIIKKSDLVACPGCYPTCSLLALLPIIDLIDRDMIIIDAKSGVSGAGRKESQALIYPETAEGAHAYSVGTHRHAPEIDQALSLASEEKVVVSFTPHLIPMNRGMIATIYVNMNEGISVEDLRASLHKKYDSENFVHIEAEGVIPHTRYVRGSNQCRIGLFPGRKQGQAILVSVIDNLAKGSSGQAVQNLNVMMGWDETLGLSSVPLFP